MNSIGSYKILETLYDKGAVQACLAVHQKLGRKTFLKIYSGLDAGLIRRFEREARIVADLDHESIVSIYDFGEEQGRYYIAMEFVDGWNLAQYLQSHELMDEEILDIAYQIAASVAVLHRKGYIHRDLKPENVLIGRDQQIKITDFGTSFQASQVRMTQNGDLNGTPLYMSPEQINNLQITASSDVFTLGIIFYQLATGIHPFYAEQYGEIFARILTLEPPPIKSIRDTIPDWFSDLVSMLLQKDASKRPKNAPEVAAEMKSRNIISDIPQLQQRTPFRYNNIKRKAIIFPLLLIVLALFFFIDGREKVDTNTNPSTELAIVFPDTLQTDSSIQPAGFQNENQTAQDISSVQAFSALAAEEKEKFSDKVESDPVIPDPGKTSLMIKTWPWCRIYLNYQFFEMTPMAAPLAIEPGKYLISLKNPLYPTWSDSIIVEANRTSTFTFKLDSIFYRLDLQVVPWGEVYVDGEFMGITPLSTPIYLSRENHSIKIKNRYFQTWEDTLCWNGEDLVKKNIVLNDNSPKRKRDGE